MDDERLRDALVGGIGAAFALGLVALWLQYALVLGALVSLSAVLCTALGGLRAGRVGALRRYLSLGLAVWLACFALMLGLPADTSTLWAGFPPATSVLIYGLWPLPLCFVTLPYVLHFHDDVLPAETLRTFDEDA